MKEILRIPQGNDFSIVVCHSVIAPANPEGIDFSDIEGLEVYLTRNYAIKEQIDYVINLSGDIEIALPHDLDCTVWGIEAVGTCEGDHWRWKSFPVFRIMDKSDCASRVNEETFLSDRYYLGDTLDIVLQDTELDIVTHGFADIDADGTLTITCTDDITMRINKDNLEVKHGYKANNCQRPAWPGACI